MIVVDGLLFNKAGGQTAVTICYIPAGKLLYEVHLGAVS